jgi:N-sulfoglucosamine sulfohydrolase
MLNIVYIHSHDTGRYIQPYGHAVPTPHLQRFAEQGTVFRNAFCAGPTCSPSRAALLTGTYPHQNGMLALAHKGGHLKDPTWHLAHHLRSNGYLTAQSGTQHVNASTIEAMREVGYDRRLSHEAWPSWIKDYEDWNTWYAMAAVEFLQKTEKDKPFFLDCGFDLTHRMGKGEQWHTTRKAPIGDPRWTRPPIPLPDTPETRRDFADFQVAAGMLDACIGRVLDAIEATGRSGDTLVFITTDHGLAYPHMKCNLTAHGTGVMLLMRGPGGFTGGKVVDGLASHVDVFPTICELAGIPAPQRLVGRSLLPLVNGAEQVQHEIFAEVNWHGTAEPMRAIRTNRHSFIHRFAPCPAGTNCDNSISKSLLLAAGWNDRARPVDELHDLWLDPNEACNLANDPAYAEVLADLQGRLLRWMESTGDPLLTGRLDHWPDGISRGPDSDPESPWMPATPIIVTHPLHVSATARTQP